ncbi:hypothetical protein D9613_009176 [Agrocybe pediades]|uniref:Small ribosomal subunit protein uS10m n=1 Tax=Agrocybe pediades TaxID=84607 RepID=A0A8H4R4E8_9AGAR|nr:hypothetical protein D9613_009176 [Agrocybe pediades]
MFRLPSVTRSTLRYSSVSVPWVRCQATAASNTPLTRGESSLPQASVSGRRRSRKRVATQQSVAPVQVEQDWKSLGLKYDPATLPIEQTLDPNERDFTEEEYAATLIHGRSVHAPFQHPRTHDIPVANIHFRSHHVKFLNMFTHFASHAAASLGIPISKATALPTKRTLWTVLRSPFAHKKSQENFDRKVHKRAIKAWDAHPEVVHRWVTYLRKHALPGVGMRVTTWDRIPVGMGSSPALVRDDSLENVAVKAPAKILELGKKIAAEEGPAPVKV